MLTNGACDVAIFGDFETAHYQHGDEYGQQECEPGRPGKRSQYVEEHGGIAAFRDQHTNVVSLEWAAHIDNVEETEQRLRAEWQLSAAVENVSIGAGVVIAHVAAIGLDVPKGSIQSVPVAKHTLKSTEKKEDWK